MAFMGVRMSWDILFKKTVFARFARSASIRALESASFFSCSSRTIYVTSL